MAPGPVDRISRRAPFTRTTRAAASDTQIRGGWIETTRTAGGVASSRNGSSTVAVPTASTASTDTTYAASRAFPTRFLPSQVTACEPGPIEPVNGVATHLPSRSTRTVTVAGAVSGTVSDSASSRPSPFGVIAAEASATRPSVRVRLTGTSTPAVRPPVAFAATWTR